jgi:hypothetical protein
MTFYHLLDSKSKKEPPVHTKASRESFFKPSSSILRHVPQHSRPFCAESFQAGEAEISGLKAEARTLSHPSSPNYGALVSNPASLSFSLSFRRSSSASYLTHHKPTLFSLLQTFDLILLLSHERTKLNKLLVPFSRKRGSCGEDRTKRTSSSPFPVSAWPGWELQLNVAYHSSEI